MPNAQSSTAAAKVALYIPYIPDENTTPALGPLYLLAVLEKHGFAVRLFDGRLDRNALQKLIAYQPDIAGISSVTAGYPGALRGAAAIKGSLPRAAVVLGGPHPSTMPDEAIRENNVDYVLCGESEYTFLDLCTKIRNTDVSAASLKTIPNLVFKDDSTVTATPRSSFLSGEELDRLPFPAFHAMDIDAYFSNSQTHGLFRKGKRVLPLMTSRGCPSACTFCCRVMGSALRCRSVDSVMREVEYLVKTYGIDELYLEDDNFTVHRSRALEILGRLAAFRPQLYVKLANGVRADLVDAELLKALKTAGVYSLSFGIESGSVSTLKKMKKNLNLAKARENVLLAKSMGFFVGSNCIIGYPGETAADVEESLRFFSSLPLNSMAIVNLVPFPGTEARSIAESKNALTPAASHWENYYFAINDPIPLIDTPELPARELIRLTHKAYRKMYLQPSWILNSIRYLTLRQIVKGASTLLFNSHRKGAVE